MDWNFPALANALSIRQYGAALAIFASLLASVLTVTVSGLYSTDRAAFRFDAKFQENSFIDYTANNGSNSSLADAANTLSLIDSFGLDFPARTYENLIYPGLQSKSLDVLDPYAQDESFWRAFLKDKIGDTSNDMNFTDVTIQADMMAHETSLDCSILPTRDTLVTMVSSSANSILVNVTAQPVISAHCAAIGTSDKDFRSPRFAWENIRLQLYENTTLRVGGYMTELVYFRDDDVQTSSAQRVAFTNKDLVDFSECPSLAFVFAVVDGANLGDPQDQGISQNSQKANITVLQCRQTLNLQDTTVRFHSPDYVIDTLNPPTVHPNMTRPQKGFALHLQQVFDNHYRLATAPADISHGFDNFMLGALFGPKHYDLSEILKHSDVGIRALQDAVSRMYGRYATQFLNTYTRRNGLQPDSDMTATVISHNAWRVIQHRGPKLALQILLLTMSLCAALSYHLVDMRRTLLREPCSIAGKASLVVGTRLLGELEERTCKEEMSSNDSIVASEQAGSKDNEILKLCWWEDYTNCGEAGYVFDHDNAESNWRIDIVCDLPESKDAC